MVILMGKTSVVLMAGSQLRIIVRVELAVSDVPAIDRAVALPDTHRLCSTARFAA